MGNCHTSESPHTIHNHSNLIGPYYRNWLVSYPRVTARCELDEGLGVGRVKGSFAFLSITNRANLLFLSRTDSATSIPLICMASAPRSLKKPMSLNGTGFKLGTEKAVGEAIKASGIPREEIFVTTKLP